MLYDLVEEKTENRWEHRWIRRPLASAESFPLMIKLAGAARWTRGMEIGRADSDLFAVEYVCSGDAVLIQDNKEYIVNRGEVFLLRKHANHLYKPGPGGIIFKRYVTIDGLDLENILRFLNLWDKDFIVPVDPKAIKLLLKRAAALIAMLPASLSSSGIDIELSSIAYHILLILSKSVRISFPASLERALEFMQTNLNRALTRKEICGYACTSISQLTRLFAEYFHQPPMNYFTDMKMNWAANMLESSKLSIKEISYRIGFENQFYFSGQFKRYFGLSPVKYRESKAVDY